MDKFKYCTGKEKVSYLLNKNYIRFQLTKFNFTLMDYGINDYNLLQTLILQKTAQDEARICSERIEVARTELRALYQGQLETVVKEKLQEFQSQLEAAEAALKAELHSKEKQWAEKANEQCRKLQEK